MTQPQRRGTATATAGTPSPWPGFLTAYFGWVFDYFEVIFLSVALVTISQELGFGTEGIALVIAVQLLAFGVGGLVFGQISDRLGRKTALQWSIILFAVATLARAFTPNIEYLVVFSIIAGIGLGGEYGAGQSLVSETVKDRSRGKWSSFLYSGIFVGIMLGGIYGSTVLQWVGWRWAFAIAAVPVLLLLVTRRWIPESEVWEKEKAENGTVRFAELLHWRFIGVLLLCVVTASLQLLAYYGVTALMPSYLVSTAGFSLTTASWWIFFTGVAGLVGATAAALVIDRIGRRVTLTSFALLGAVAAGSVVVIWTQMDQNIPVSMIGFFFLYAAFGGTASVFGSLFSEVFPTRVRGTGVSAALQLARGVSAAAPLIAGALYPIFGYLPLIIGAAGLLVVLAVMARVFPERTAQSITSVGVDGGNPLA
ncbi:MFS transporter [Microbacterium sp. 1.5R]|uniref:MFS transporter n=1 Tax=Microbacterium sp. 1.5R TaxID=1916917 RepID=UPI001C92D146|nr:MFS transporter [Microbacterium sp. 1.5R]